MALIPGRWRGRNLAAGQTSTELHVDRSGFIDDVQTPANSILQSVSPGQAVALPPWEARLWARLGLFIADPTFSNFVDTTGWTADSTAFTADAA